MLDGKAKASEGVIDMKQYWVSLLVQENEKSKPWLCSMTSSCLSISEAMSVIEKGRKNYRVLSAWVDTYENNVKSIVFHECYVDAVGNIEQ
ncbi:MAG: hypothetical protein GX285_07955 [Clostridiales bacterium]|nr:hypothetical protein [Clostridiales bacterium]